MVTTTEQLFNEEFYISRNSDVAQAVNGGLFSSGFEHFLAFGINEFRDPSLDFDFSYYTRFNQDIGNLNPLQHYIDIGEPEGRPAVDNAFFSENLYLSNNIDVLTSGINPREHYLVIGGFEGRDPSLYFDSSFYLQNNPDVLASGMNPLQHFLDYGIDEGRSPFSNGIFKTEIIIPSSNFKTLIPQDEILTNTVGGVDNVAVETRLSELFGGGTPSFFLLNSSTTTSTGVAPAPSFPPTVEIPPGALTTLDGANGFQIDGVKAYDYSGKTISSAGDINGDGFADILVGANRDDPGGSSSGSSHLIFGSANSFSTPIVLSSLNGTNGFRIDGVSAYDQSGRNLSSAGDINGDGLDDMIIGAIYADPGGNGDAGSSYIVFGSAAAFPATTSLSSLNGTNGFRLDGVATNDFSGAVKGVGDINGDGLDDIITGAFGANTGGSSYVVFGSEDPFAASINLSTLNGTNGFRLDGAAGDSSGRFMGSAGDINGDGLDDLLISATGGGAGAGAAYVVFGTETSSSAFDLSTLNGTNGFLLNGIAFGDNTGTSLSSAGDVNGDGFDDIIIGAKGADPGGIANAGSSYVVFGAAGGFAASTNLSTLNGTNGFRIDGEALFDLSGSSVSSAGDVNGDGFDDLIVGAYGVDDGPTFSVGSSYIVFGGNSFSATFSLSSINGSNGFSVDGLAQEDRLGDFVSGAGDINGDGFDDVIASAYSADPYGGYSGSTYVIFGGNFTSSLTHQGTAGADNIIGSSNDDIIVADRGDDTINGGAGSDVLIGAEGNDLIIFDDSDKVIRGGLGNDTLQVTGSDLTNVDIFREVETITISGAGTNLTASAKHLHDVRTIIGDAGFQTLTLTDKDNLSPITNTGLEIIQLNNNVDVTIDEDNLTDLTSILGSAGTETVTINIAASNGDANVSALTVTDLEGFIINGADGTNDITANITNDTVFGGDDNDTIDGGDGNDSIRGENGNDSINGGSGNDNLSGNVGNDFVDGGDGNDTINDNGGALGGDDTFNGGDGDDSINSGLGNDVIDGGLGNDTIFGSTGDDLVNGGDGDDSITDSGGNNTIQGDDGNDTIIGDDDNDSLLGGNGNDNITGSSGNDTIEGGNNDDTLNGNSDDDVINGDSGNDFINGGSGNNTLSGGVGNDSILGGNVDDTLNGDDGNDLLQGGNGDDLINGGDGNDTVISGTGNKTIFGNDGDDNLTGFDGSDTINGGEGNDVLTGGNNDDSLVGGNGNDTLDSGNGNDTLIGGDGDDVFNGFDGNEIHDGGLGNDSILAGNGDDTITGGAGVDTLNSGAGNDIFIFSDLTHSTDTAQDTITFFSGTDIFNLQGLGLTFGDLSITDNGVDTTVADTGSTFSFLLNGVHTLVAGDFLF